MTLFVLGRHQFDCYNMAMPKMRNKANNQAYKLGFFKLFIKKGRVAQRITRLPTEQKIAGSSPAVVGILFYSL